MKSILFMRALFSLNITIKFHHYNIITPNKSSQTEYPRTWECGAGAAKPSIETSDTPSNAPLFYSPLRIDNWSVHPMFNVTPWYLTLSDIEIRLIIECFYNFVRF